MAKQKKAPPPTPEKIIAALKRACERRKANWPIRYPSPHNISPDNQDYGFFMELHATLATELGWRDLQMFIKEVTGTASKIKDWSTTYREALDLVHTALGMKGGKEGPIPDRIRTLAKWSIDRDQILTQEQYDMAKKKAPAAAVEDKKAPAAASLAPAKPKKGPAKAPEPLDPVSLGGLQMAAAVIGTFADYATQVAEETKGDARLDELAEHLSKAADLLDKITG